ncbi:hypothetical protein SAPIO_CDS4824 [Scedosporium apiospermum]|uniref:Uncharacterized protein n=1 Tax=Pseudallescheria apiosperma TaxID=563466 RepID=A0A084G7Q2_PSEDA|nr:uncharacterized protein SAPIO_CDS4824 [Scedosporium apiospermum]KEZ43364.1 hypothetical protein SAPIO_CDS4824 [Scedosporium apiospermum]
MPNLSGKVVVVTGGSTGIGYATVRLLARRGAKVYFTTRSEPKARKAHQTLASDSEVEPENVIWLVMDLFDLRSINAATDELKRRETKVDILINNAAASTSSTDLVEGRYEQHMAAKFLFGFDMIRYAVSKAAAILFTKELQRRLDDQDLPILCVAVHPAEQGAATPFFAAVAGEVRQKANVYKGRFLVPIGKVETPNAVAEDNRQIKGLWENTTQEVNKQLAEYKLPSLEAW